MGRAVIGLHPCPWRCLGDSLEDETNVLLLEGSNIGGWEEVAVSLGLAVCLVA